jgi:hypothetical protein
LDYRRLGPSLLDQIVCYRLGRFWPKLFFFTASFFYWTRLFVTDWASSGPNVFFFYWVIFFKAFTWSFYLKHLLGHFSYKIKLLHATNWTLIFVISFEFWPNKINPQYKIHSK